MKISLPIAADEEIGFQMSPMIDCVFLLIIFFLVVAKDKIGERVVMDLAVAEESEVAKDPSGRATMSILKDGTIKVGAATVDLSEVGRIIREGYKSNPRLKVLLRVDRDAKHKEVRKVLKACADAGVTDIIFATYQSEV